MDTNPSQTIPPQYPIHNRTLKRWYTRNSDEQRSRFSGINFQLVQCHFPHCNRHFETKVCELGSAHFDITHAQKTIISHDRPEILDELIARMGLGIDMHIAQKHTRSKGSQWQEQGLSRAQCAGEETSRLGDAEQPRCKVPKWYLYPPDLACGQEVCERNHQLSCWSTATGRLSPLCGNTYGRVDDVAKSELIVHVIDGSLIWNLNIESTQEKSEDSRNTWRKTCAHSPGLFLPYLHFQALTDTGVAWK